MSSTAQHMMLNHGLFDEEEDTTTSLLPSHLGILNNLPAAFLQASSSSASMLGYDDQFPLRILNSMNDSTSPSDDRSSLVVLSGDDLLQTCTATIDGQRGCGFKDQFLGSVVRSTTKYRAKGELGDCINGKRSEHIGVKMKKIMKARRKVRDPRFSFKTMSDVDVLDDGYKWRKYGQKVVKDTLHPRSYYRCTQDNCRVKKRIERLAEDPRMVITTYEGRHVHSPSHDEGDDPRASSSSSSQLNNFFW